LNGFGDGRPAVEHVVVCKYQPELVAAFLAAGAEVSLVLDRADRVSGEPDPALLARCRAVHTVTAFDSLAELSAVAVEMLHRGPGVDLVVNQQEPSQFGAGYLQVLLGLAADPLDHVSHRDKRLQKARVRAAGVRTAEFRSLPDAADTAAVADVARQLRPPYVVKPAAGYGTLSTLLVEDAERLAPALAALSVDATLRSRHLVVEEYVAGEELAVDALWADGKELALVVHAYHRPRILQDAGLLDGSVILSPADHPDAYAAVREIHALVNPALGIREGTTHLEVFARPDGEFVFSEVATRVGGGWVPDMLGAYHGRPVWDQIAQAALHGSIAEPRPRRRHVGGVALKPGGPGVIIAEPSDAELAAFPGVLGWRRVRGLGETVRQVRSSDWFLHVTIGADSAEELLARCLRAGEDLAIRTENRKAGV
jgi:biotin carboxylase